MRWGRSVDVVHSVRPAVFLTEIHGDAALRQGLTVPQMVVAGHNDALLVEIAGKIVIPPDVLRHAVGYLQNTPKFDLFVRDPEAGVELGLPVGGEKTEIFTICHRICAPSVVYLQYRPAGTALCSPLQAEETIPLPAVYHAGAKKKRGEVDAAVYFGAGSGDDQLAGDPV